MTFNPQVIAERDGRMWAFVIGELTETKALLSTVLALVRLQMLQSGIPQQTVDQKVEELMAKYRFEAQEYSKTLLDAILPVKEA